MDVSRSCFLTPDMKRLVTFHETPIRSSLCRSLSNSASKFSQAGFERKPDAIDDIVECSECGASFRDWEGESPIAVHRVISPNCPFLNRGFDDPHSDRLLEREGVRRQLFPSSPGTEDTRPSQRVLHRQNVIRHPFKPKFGGFEMLFASHRLLTFGDLSHPRSSVLAENGFVYRQESADVLCVYCGVVLDVNIHQPKLAHERESPDCPFVLLFDVGNIGREEEGCIRLKYFQQRQRVTNTSVFTIRHPECESVDVRRATFANWPRHEAALDPKIMSGAGFYYTNFTDKVRCFCCGVSMYGWHADGPVDVWQQHAKGSPTCYFVLQCKGQHFVQEAAAAEWLATCIGPNERNEPVTSSEGVVAELPGSLTMDMTPIQGALACQYTIERVRHAVLKYFLLTCLYPNEPCLIATLKAEDENYVTVCEQRETILCNEQALEAKERTVQEKERAVQQKEQEKERAVQQKEQEKQRAVQQERQEKQTLQAALQENQREQQQKDQVIQEKDQVIQEKDQVIQENYQVIQEKDQVIQENLVMMNQQALELNRKDQQIQLLLQQLQSLQAQLPEEAGQLAPEPDLETVEPNEDIPERVRCKVCLNAESSVLILPCHHVSCCAQCVTSLHTTALDERRRCPVCRAHIEETHPAFIA
ncbi:hypothetical protein BaRGS_00038917 [Batillaria attramentaria]|uniref:RING-type domain-containing protein n=1 Tax=Batillaria attramentaria TaxID=370345 RepID=A0ABD0J5G3_9CAEN